MSGNNFAPNEFPEPNAVHPGEANPHLLASAIEPPLPPKPSQGAGAPAKAEPVAHPAKPEPQPSGQTTSGHTEVLIHKGDTIYGHKLLGNMGHESDAAIFELNVRAGKLAMPKIFIDKAGRETCAPVIHPGQGLLRPHDNEKSLLADAWFARFRNLHPVPGGIPGKGGTPSHGGEKGGTPGKGHDGGTPGKDKGGSPEPGGKPGNDKGGCPAPKPGESQELKALKAEFAAKVEAQKKIAEEIKNSAMKQGGLGATFDLAKYYLGGHKDSNDWGEKLKSFIFNKDDSSLAMMEKLQEKTNELTTLKAQIDKLEAQEKAGSKITADIQNERTAVKNTANDTATLGRSYRLSQASGVEGLASNAAFIAAAATASTGFGVLEAGAVAGLVKGALIGADSGRIDKAAVATVTGTGEGIISALGMGAAGKAIGWAGTTPFASRFGLKVIGDGVNTRVATTLTGFGGKALAGSINLLVGGGAVGGATNFLDASAHETYGYAKDVAAGRDGRFWERAENVGRQTAIGTVAGMAFNVGSHFTIGKVAERVMAGRAPGMIELGSKPVDVASLDELQAKSIFKRGVKWLGKDEAPVFKDSNDVVHMWSNDAHNKFVASEGPRVGHGLVGQLQRTPSLFEKVEVEIGGQKYKGRFWGFAETTGQNGAKQQYIRLMPEAGSPGIKPELRGTKGVDRFIPVDKVESWTFNGEHVTKPKARTGVAEKAIEDAKPAISIKATGTGDTTAKDGGTQSTADAMAILIGRYDEIRRQAQEAKVPAQVHDHVDELFESIRTKDAPTKSSRDINEIHSDLQKAIDQWHAEEQKKLVASGASQEALDKLNGQRDELRKALHEVTAEFQPKPQAEIAAATDTTTTGQVASSGAEARVQTAEDIAAMERARSAFPGLLEEHVSKAKEAGEKKLTELNNNLEEAKKAEVEAHAKLDQIDPLNIDQMRKAHEGFMTSAQKRQAIEQEIEKHIQGNNPNRVQIEAAQKEVVSVQKELDAVQKQVADSKKVLAEDLKAYKNASANAKNEYKALHEAYDKINPSDLSKSGHVDHTKLNEADAALRKAEEKLKTSMAAVDALKEQQKSLKEKLEAAKANFAAETTAKSKTETNGEETQKPEEAPKETPEEATAREQAERASLEASRKEFPELAKQLDRQAQETEVSAKIQQLELEVKKNVADQAESYGRIKSLDSEIFGEHANARDPRFNEGYLKSIEKDIDAMKQAHHQVSIAGISDAAEHFPQLGKLSGLEAEIKQYRALQDKCSELSTTKDQLKNLNKDQVTSTKSPVASESSSTSEKSTAPKGDSTFGSTEQSPKTGESQRENQVRPLLRDIPADPTTGELRVRFKTSNSKESVVKILDALDDIDANGSALKHSAQLSSKRGRSADANEQDIAWTITADAKVIEALKADANLKSQIESCQKAPESKTEQALDHRSLESFLVSIDNGRPKVSLTIGKGQESELLAKRVVESIKGNPKVSAELNGDVLSLTTKGRIGEGLKELERTITTLDAQLKQDLGTARKAYSDAQKTLVQVEAKTSADETGTTGNGTHTVAGAGDAGTTNNGTHTVAGAGDVGTTGNGTHTVAGAGDEGATDNGTQTTASTTGADNTSTQNNKPGSTAQTTGQANLQRNATSSEKGDSTAGSTTQSTTSQKGDSTVTTVSTEKSTKPGEAQPLSANAEKAMIRAELENAVSPYKLTHEKGQAGFNVQIGTKNPELFQLIKTALPPASGMKCEYKGGTVEIRSMAKDDKLSLPRLQEAREKLQGNPELKAKLDAALEASRRGPKAGADPATTSTNKVETKVETQKSTSAAAESTESSIILANRLENFENGRLMKFLKADEKVSKVMSRITGSQGLPMELRQADPVDLKAAITALAPRYNLEVVNGRLEKAGTAAPVENKVPAAPEQTATHTPTAPETQTIAPVAGAEVDPSASTTTSTNQVETQSEPTPLAKAAPESAKAEESNENVESEYEALGPMKYIKEGANFKEVCESVKNDEQDCPGFKVQGNGAIRKEIKQIAEQNNLRVDTNGVFVKIEAPQPPATVAEAAPEQVQSSVATPEVKAVENTGLTSDMPRSMEEARQLKSQYDEKAKADPQYAIDAGSMEDNALLACEMEESGIGQTVLDLCKEHTAGTVEGMLLKMEPINETVEFLRNSSELTRAIRAYRTANGISPLNPGLEFMLGGKVIPEAEEIANPQPASSDPPAATGNAGEGDSPKA